MASKLNINKIESYSIAFSEKLCKDIFENQKYLSGLELLKLTHIDQVNFFLLRNLYEKWSEEQVRLRSPYFNYDAEEVKTALSQLSNKLSNNIQVEKEFLKPLLIKAVSESLQWIIAPQDYIVQQIKFGLLDTVAKIKESYKYFKINRIIISEMLADWNNDLSGKDLKIIESKINQIVESRQNELDDPNMWIERFGSLLSFDISDILLSINKDSISESKVTLDSELKSETRYDEINRNNQPEAKAEKQLSNKEVSIANPSILNDHFIKEQPTLNEMLLEHKKDAASVNDALSNSKIDDLRSAITLNKRFEIINELFRGNTGEYLFAIEDIENANTYNDAIQVLEAKFAHKYNWSFDNELLREFLKLIERRFL